MKSESGPRPYRMSRRADQVNETRQRIVEAAVRLHTTVGPAHTTISGIAEEAAVTRLTVYRHFPDEVALFGACTAHWVTLHPPPDPAAWQAISGLAARTELALDELYGWFRDNADDLFALERDVDAMPPAFRDGIRTARNARAEALVAGSGARGHARRRLRAAAGHVVSFWTWWSLAMEQDLDHEDCVAMAASLILNVAPQAT